MLAILQLLPYIILFFLSLVILLKRKEFGLQFPLHICEKTNKKKGIDKVLVRIEIQVTDYYDAQSTSNSVTSTILLIL